MSQGGVKTQKYTDKRAGRVNYMDRTIYYFYEWFK